MADEGNFSKDIVDLWSDIFNDIDMNVVPLNYIHMLEIKFKNQKVWEINFKKNLKIQSWEIFEQELKNIIKSYEDQIQSIDVKLDTDKIKKDIGSSTKKFLKNKKLK